jgi:hypothetical protein
MYDIEIYLPANLLAAEGCSQVAATDGVPAERFSRLT